MRKWDTLADLAALMIARSRTHKTVTVTSETAFVIGLKLMTADAKPTHDAVLKMICDSRCQHRCVPCTFKANAICAAYGQSWAPPLQDNADITPTLVTRKKSRR